MSILQNSNAISAGGYDINNSLRFRSSASAYLNRTFGSTYTDKTKSTVSFWVKRGSLNINNGHTIMWYNASGASGHITFAGSGAGGTLVNDCLNFSNRNATTGSGDYGFQTTQLFRDPSAWYHIIIVFDTGQATSTNRVKLYVNGTQVTAFVSTQYPSQNYQTTAFLGGNSAAHIIGYGATTGATEYFDGYLADFNFIDGQALTPSSFGETDTITGVWKPKAYSGTYGTNGFYLKFSDIATTSGSNAGLGKDFSGNSNYWTTNNISVTSGTTYDAMTDSPTLTSATVANYPTLNPLTNGGGTYSNGNLQFTGPTNWVNAMSTMEIPSTGKFYAEATLIGTAQSNNQGDAYAYFGVRPTTASPTTAAGTDGNALYVVDTGWYANFVAYPNGTNIGSKFSSGDVIGLAIDRTANTYTFYKNNTSFSSGTINYTSGNPLSFVYGSYNSSYGQMAVNFGQRPFAYTPPTGYNRLNTYNLPDSTIKKGNSYMDATLYSGNSTTVTATNAGAFKPDLVWIKDRTSVAQHVLTDSVRGTSAQLFSSLTNAEQSNSTYVTSFNSNGFTVGVGNSGTGVVNNTGDNFVAWQWQAGQGTNTTNTAGSITSTVSVNTTAGFSIVTFTGNGVNSTVGHGLGVAPKMIIEKERSAASNWSTYHASLGATKAVYLNKINAEETQTAFWNSTAPTSTVFSLGTDGDTNSNGVTYVAYCWAEIAGFSKFGSYTGNGSTDGTFVYTGFRPKYIMHKRTDTTSDWIVLDTSRDTYNYSDKELYPDLSNAEGVGGSTNAHDLLSNGFKLRSANAQSNASGGTYIYAAFAENPFKNANAR